MDIHISKDFIFAFIAGLILLALILANGKTTAGRKWLSSFLFGLMMLASWAGFFSVIKSIAEKFN